MPPSLRLGYEAMHDIRVAAMSKLLTEDEMRVFVDPRPQSSLQRGVDNHIQSDI